MGLFGRLFKITEAEAHNVVDKLENPIKLTEQGIRDLKTDLDKSIRALAEVKATAIRSRREADNHKKLSDDYQRKAMMLLGKAQAGEISESDADRLATESLQLKEQNDSTWKVAQTNTQKFEQHVAKLDTNIQKLKSTISKYENELRTLKARAKVSEATKQVNKQLASVDSGSTVNMLERMKERVDQDEAEAEAYGEIALGNTSVDDEINSALSTGGSAGGSDALAALKAKMSGGSSTPRLEQ